MKILCFGIAREIIGSSEYELRDANIKTVTDLKKYITAQFSDFNQYKKFRVAVNQSFANDDTPISQQDEIAIIPPVSGG